MTIAALPITTRPITRRAPRPAAPIDHWQRARQAWLDGQTSPHTRRVYNTALDQLLTHTQCHPSQLTGADLIAWQQHLRQTGRSDTTINIKLAAVSSYYTYCQRNYTLTGPDNRPQPLTDHNPAQRPERAKIQPYSKTTHLDLHQLRDLLRAIDRRTPTGLRDYALILFYLYTGRRSSEGRLLQWRHITTQNNRAYYTWTGKGQTGRTDELPWPVHHAITAYHQAAGRQIGPDSYLFTPLPGGSLPNLSHLPPNRPLSSAAVNQIIKRAAKRAGLDPTTVRTHTLRHSAAMLRRSLTDDLQEIQTFLNHASLATTQIYLQHTDQRLDPRWMQIQELLES